jgi:hypothetical protein
MALTEAVSRPYYEDCEEKKGGILTYTHRYWQFLLYLFIALTFFELLLAPMPAFYTSYSPFIGYLGLGIEATLPLPQILSNSRSRSCKGFRLSVLASWIAGDIMKMFWFFSATTEIPWAFKLCGIFQMCCDLFLGAQYWVFGDGSRVAGPPSVNGFAGPSRPPSGKGIPLGEKDARLE